MFTNKNIRIYFQNYYKRNNDTNNNIRIFDINNKWSVIDDMLIEIKNRNYQTYQQPIRPRISNIWRKTRIPTQNDQLTDHLLTYCTQRIMKYTYVIHIK
jgi:hypothetical protein